MPIRVSDSSRRKSREKYRVASAGMHQSHSFRNNAVASGKTPLRHEPCLQVWGTQEDVSLLRCGGLLLPGNRIHRGSGAHAEEGVHLVTGSTHKTFFGTQRRHIADSNEEHEERYEL